MKKYFMLLFLIFLLFGCGSAPTNGPDMSSGEEVAAAGDDDGETTVTNGGSDEGTTTTVTDEDGTITDGSLTDETTTEVDDSDSPDTETVAEEDNSIEEISTMFADSSFIEFGTYGGDYPTSSYDTFKIVFKEDNTFTLYGYYEGGVEAGSTFYGSTSTENVTYKFEPTNTTVTYTKSFLTDTQEEVIIKFVFTKTDDDKTITCTLLYTSGDRTLDSWGPVEISLVE